MTSKEKQINKLHEKPSNLTEDYSFNEVVDKACEKLRGCQIKHSIRRIQEMYECLNNLERELDNFLKDKR